MQSQLIVVARRQQRQAGIPCCARFEAGYRLAQPRLHGLCPLSHTEWTVAVGAQQPETRELAQGGGGVTARAAAIIGA